MPVGNSRRLDPAKIGGGEPSRTEYRTRYKGSRARMKWVLACYSKCQKYQLMNCQSKALLSLTDNARPLVFSLQRANLSITLFGSPKPRVSSRVSPLDNESVRRSGIQLSEISSRLPSPHGSRRHRRSSASWFVVDTRAYQTAFLASAPPQTGASIA
jgi:hypothetical protein